MAKHYVAQMLASLHLFPDDRRIELMKGIIENLSKVPNEPRLEPLVATRIRGRPSLSTRRLPSKFEIVDQNLKAHERLAKRKGKGKGKAPSKRRKVRTMSWFEIYIGLKLT